MKRPKDRLYRVIVIGATPAGIAATNKLGELGIPVTLVDSDFDLDTKLSKDKWRLNSKVPFNFAHRSGIVRIFGNRSICCILLAEVISIKHNLQGFVVKIKKTPTYVDPEKCTLCGRCTDNCPVTVKGTNKAIIQNSRQSLPGRPVIDKRKIPNCQASCPLGVNTQGYIALATAGKYLDAIELIRKDNILPGICGRICTHPCEDTCRRQEIDESIAIRDIKRYLADYEKSHHFDNKPDQKSDKSSLPTGKKIAVIGSGPAGLAAAADLVRSGCSVTIFEKEKLAGGLLRYGIGQHRLPREILDLEIEYIEQLGVEFKTSSPVDLNSEIDTLKKEFDAVILTTGVLADRRLGVSGEDSKYVDGCLSFLKKIYNNKIERLEKKVAVIGDGNAAFDLARTLVRIDADVTILSWFPKDLIPADQQEIKGALDEGVKIKDSTKTVEFIEKNGRLSHLVCMPTMPGEPDSQGIKWPVIVPQSEPFELSFDMALVAIGQKSTFNGKGFEGKFEITKEGFIQTDEYHRTSLSKVYAAGDAVLGPSSVVEAMASGRKVAGTVYSDIFQKDISQCLKNISKRPEDIDFDKIPEDIPSQTRPAVPERQPSVRCNNFSEVTMGFDESQVTFETNRCLQCGVCSECFQCIDACGPINAINHNETAQVIKEHGGVVIIADPNMAPIVRGEDIIRAYGPKAAKTDVNAMLMRGFAAAADAMLLLEETSRRPKGHGIFFSPPDIGLSPEIRIGVFACRCNDSLGWTEGMSEHIDSLNSKDEVVCAEVINAACVPDGYSNIIRTIREKGITRVVLATCVCCPLNFICSSCTYQRNRLKDALFVGTGISRSMVETCNLRGEVLSLIKHDPALAINRFKGLIDRSLKRAAQLKLLAAHVRAYNFTTAVIGGSEAASYSAITLAEAGIEVFWFQNYNTRLKKLPEHPNIHSFEGYHAKEFSGSLGDFKIFVVSKELQQTIHVGAVILDEKSRKNVQYIYNEGLSNRNVEFSIQKEGVLGIPFFYPGKTSIAGVFLADPPGINISNRKKGASAAVHAAAIMPSGPRQSKGFTVAVDQNLCRGCGRCIRFCPYQAITLQKNNLDQWSASVDEAMCQGCGNCISVCPTNAADSPYRNQAFLELSLEELLEKQNGTV